MKRFLPAISIILTILLAGFLYRDSFGGYFFQDDWFSFQISKVESIQDFLNFFIPRTDVIYYRPLGMQMPFFIMYSLFKLNPLGYHLLIFLTHTVNIILVYLLIKKLIGNRITPSLAALLYGTSTVHYIPFYWFSTYAFILGPTFFFLTFIFFIRYLETQNKSLLFWYIIFFVSGILTNEMVVMFFPIQLVYSLIYYQKYKHTLGKPLILSLLITFSLIIIRLLFKPPTTGSYELSIGKHILNNLHAYIIWSLNWPEEMKAQFVNFYRVNPEFIKNFSVYYYTFLITFILLIILLFIIPIYKTVKLKRTKNMQSVLFGAIWFILGLVPVLLFPSHSFAYYLPISLVGLFLSASLLVHKIWIVFKKNIYIRNTYIYVIIVCWILSAFTTIEFNNKVHWAPRRSATAKEYAQRAQIVYPQGLKDTYTFYINPSSENKLALNDQDGLRILFNNPLIQTVYGYQEGKESL